LTTCLAIAAALGGLRPKAIASMISPAYGRAEMIQIHVAFHEQANDFWRVTGSISKLKLCTRCVEVVGGRRAGVGVTQRN
jgi:hypothetical protein